MKREHLEFKHNLAYKLYSKTDLKTNIMRRAGIIEDESKKKLAFRFRSFTRIMEPGIDHYKSQHTLSLQRSKYITVDDDISKEVVLDLEKKKRLV